jgi:hypothetical protein
LVFFASIESSSPNYKVALTGRSKCKEMAKMNRMITKIEENNTDNNEENNKENKQQCPYYAKDNEVHCLILVKHSFLTHLVIINSSKKHILIQLPVELFTIKLH